MLKFIGKRLLRFIPILFCITLLGFILTASMPGDPVERIMIARYGVSFENSILTSEDTKAQLRAELGLNKPLFYFSVNSYNECDTLYKIANVKKRDAMSRMTTEHGCWEQIQDYFITINQEISRSDECENLLRSLSTAWREEKITAILEELNIIAPAAAERIKTKLESIKQHASTVGNYIPTFNFHGADNRYHYWLFGNEQGSMGLLNGSFGYSYKTGEQIDNFLWKKLGYSLELIFFAMLLAFAFAIPVGLRLSRIKAPRPQKFWSTPIFILYSIPGYLGATLLIFLFANDQTLHWFPESGLYPLGYHPEENNYWQNLITAFPYMVLPLITFGYSAFAFVSKLTRNVSTEELYSDYVKTALSKGLSEKQTLRKHVLKNTLIPLITLFTQILPAAVGGTLIIELIFQYPGLGKSIYDAAFSSDYPVIIAAFTLTGILTLLAYLIADVLYALVNPKMRQRP